MFLKNLAELYVQKWHFSLLKTWDLSTLLFQLGGVNIYNPTQIFFYPEGFPHSFKQTQQKNQMAENRADLVFTNSKQNQHFKFIFSFHFSLILSFHIKRYTIYEILHGISNITLHIKHHTIYQTSHAISNVTQHIKHHTTYQTSHNIWNGK